MILTIMMPIRSTLDKNSLQCEIESSGSFCIIYCSGYFTSCRRVISGNNELSTISAILLLMSTMLPRCLGAPNDYEKFCYEGAQSLVYGIECLVLQSRKDVIVILIETLKDGFYADPLFKPLVPFGKPHLVSLEWLLYFFNLLLIYYNDIRTGQEASICIFNHNLS